MSVTGSLVISGLQRSDHLTEKRRKVVCRGYSGFVQAEILLKTTQHCKTLVPAAGRGRGRGPLSVLLPQKSLTQTYGISWE